MKTKVLFIIFLAMTVTVIGWVMVVQGSVTKKRVTKYSPQQSAQPTSAPAAPVESAEGNIRVSEPKPHTTLKVPFTIKGEARVFENVIQVRIENQDKQVMYQGFGTAQSPDVGEFGPFEFTIDGKENILQFMNLSKSGEIIVFEASAKDGSEVNIVKIPFTLSK
jgi:hypothetical protein